MAQLQDARIVQGDIGNKYKKSSPGPGVIRDALNTYGVNYSVVKDMHLDKLERLLPLVEKYGSIAVDQINKNGTAYEADLKRIEERKRLKTMQQNSQSVPQTSTGQSSSKQTTAPSNNQGGANNKQQAGWLPVAALSGGVLVLMGGCLCTQ